MDAKLGFMASLCFAEMPAEKVCDALRGLGYDSVEWTLAHLNPREKSLSDIKKVVKATSESGLLLSEVVVQQDYVALDEAVREDRIKFTLECIDAFADAGIGCVNLFTGPVPWIRDAVLVGRDLSMSQAWGMAFKAFDRIVPHAERRGVALALENVWGMLAHDFFSCKFFVDNYGSESLGVNFDPSHDILAGNLDAAWIAAQWGGKIKHCHIKDAAGIQEMGKFVFPLVGEGLVDWQAFFKALDSIGFKGTCSVEFESFDYLAKILGGDIAEAARVSIENLKRLGL